jgi:hypothetical protein
LQENFGRAPAFPALFAGKERSASGSTAFEGPGIIGMKQLHFVRLGWNIMDIKEESVQAWVDRFRELIGRR